MGREAVEERAIIKQVPFEEALPVNDKSEHSNQRDLFPVPAMNSVLSSIP
jgi:hypothetical protein